MVSPTNLYMVPPQKLIYGHPKINHWCAFDHVQSHNFILRCWWRTLTGGGDACKASHLMAESDGAAGGQCGGCSSVRSSGGGWLGLLLLPAFVLCWSYRVILLIRSAALHPGTRTSQVSGRGCGTASLGAAPQPWVLPASRPVCKWLGLILGM